MNQAMVYSLKVWVSTVWLCCIADKIEFVIHAQSLTGMLGMILYITIVHLPSALFYSLILACLLYTSIKLMQLRQVQANRVKLVLSGMLLLVMLYFISAVWSKPAGSGLITGNWIAFPVIAAAFVWLYRLDLEYKEEEN